MKRRVFLLQAIVFTAIMSYQCDRLADPAVARVGNSVIRLSEFEKDYARNKTPNFIKTTTFEERKDHLLNMVGRQLKILDAYQTGYDKHKDVVNLVSTEVNRILYSSYVEKEVIDRVVSEDEIRDLWRKTSVQVKARHVLLRVAEGADEIQTESVRQEALQLRSRIVKGERFEDIAKEHSQDHVSGAKGGDLGLIRWAGAGYNDAFYEAAFKLNIGEVSAPVRSDKGFHLIRVDDRQVSGMGDLEDVRDRIKQQILRTKQKEAQDKYYALADEIKQKYKTVFDSTNIDLFARKAGSALFDTTAADPAGGGAPPDQFAKIAKEDENLVLASYVGGAITVGQVVKHLRRYPAKRQPRLHTVKAVGDWANQLLRVELMTREARRQGLHKTDEFRRQEKTLLEQEILRRINADMIRKKVSLTEEDYSSYFEAHREKYTHPVRTEVQEIFVSQRSQADRLMRRARAGEDFSQLARQHTERASAKDADGVLGYISERQYGEIGKRASKMEIGHISGIIPLGNKYSIIKVLSRRESRLKTYDEAATTVRRDLVKEEESRLEKEWLEDVRSRNNVLVHDEALQGAFKDLFEQ